MRYLFKCMNEALLEDVIEWDVPNWSGVLPFWKQHLPDKQNDLKILTIGERNGGLSLWLALQGYAVMYSDVHEPREEAIALHRKYGVQDIISYEQVDVFSMPYEDNSLDAIVCKSVIGGLKLVYKDRRTRTLENQKKAVEEIRRVLKPGGVFLGAENMKGSPLHHFYRKYKGLDKGWRYLSLEELEYLFSGFSKLESKQFGFLPSTTSLKGLNKIAGRLNVLLALCLPASWQYISFLSALK